MICSSRIILWTLSADLRKFICPTFQLDVCLLSFSRDTHFSAISFLAHVQHDVSIYSIIGVGLWHARKSGGAGFPIEAGLP